MGNPRGYSYPDYCEYGPYIGEYKYEPDDGKSGFFDLPRRFICRDKSHNPPNMLYIPPGKAYRHVCPRCGYTVVMCGSRVRW